MQLINHQHRHHHLDQKLHHHHLPQLNNQPILSFDKLSDIYEKITIKQINTVIDKYLKKEFKKVTGKELSVEKHGDMKMLVEEISKIRTQVTAQCHYKIKNVDMPKLEDKKDVERAEQFQKWLKLGGFKK